MYVFLFADIEGSSRLGEEHTGAMTGVIARHDAILRKVVSTQGEPIPQARNFLVPEGAPVPSLISSSDEKRYSNIEASRWAVTRSES